MKVRLPVASGDPVMTRLAGLIEAAFERVREYAVLPPGGAAGSVLVKKDARDFNPAWESRADTAANIASKTAAINTTGKYQGRCVYDTTNNRLMVANGPSSTDLWFRADGGISVTPA